MASVTDGYRLWLAGQPLSVNTRRTYLGRVRQYCAYLEISASDYGDPLSDPHARDYDIRVATIYLQAHHLDLEFYDAYYKPGAYLRTLAGGVRSPEKLGKTVN